MFVADVSPAPLSPVGTACPRIGIYAVPTGLSRHRGFGFYKYAAPTELKADNADVTFQKLFDLLIVSRLGFVPQPSLRQKFSGILEIGFFRKIRFLEKFHT
ncbi:hypothetical protein QUF90_17810 [Desulfococcaceae bacterium HSG9]|nr:hypothetical protein [Desulfococcaceae bacterium HSG9]